MSFSLTLLQAVKDTPWAELPTLLKKTGVVAGTSMQAMQPPPSPTPSQASDSEACVKVETETGPVVFKAVRTKKPGRKAPVYVCSGCDAEFGSVNGCKSHILREHSGEPLVCYVCDWATYNEDSLAKHIRDNHPEK